MKRRYNRSTKSGKEISRTQVRQMIASEMKTIVEDKVTYTHDTATVDWNGGIYNISMNLARGDNAIDNFTGNLVKPVSVRIRAEWSTNQIFTTCRILVFQWKDDLVPVPAGILQNTGNVRAPLSSLFWTNVHKISVLADELITLFPVAGSYAATTVDIHIQKAMKTIQFQSTSSQQQMNGLYMLVISDDIVPTYPQFSFWTEFIFNDA